MTPDQEGQASPRWAFMDGFQVRKQNRPYLDRLRLIQTPWFGVLLHRIHGPDEDHDPHDHPWPFGSLILSGSYTEEVWAPAWGDRRVLHGQVGELSRRKRWSWHWMPTDRAHKITETEGLLWTLVITGRRTHEWGFWTSDGFMPWREYLNGGEIMGLLKKNNSGNDNGGDNNKNSQPEKHKHNMIFVRTTEEGTQIWKCNDVTCGKVDRHD
jgi:hypothetical protein